jgi:hypothetical protein
MNEMNEIDLINLAMKLTAKMDNLKLKNRRLKIILADQFNQTSQTSQTSQNSQTNLSQIRQNLAFKSVFLKQESEAAHNQQPAP